MLCAKRLFCNDHKGTTFWHGCKNEVNRQVDLLGWCQGYSALIIHEAVHLHAAMQRPKNVNFVPIKSLTPSDIVPTHLLEPPLLPFTLGQISHTCVDTFDPIKLSCCEWRQVQTAGTLNFFSFPTHTHTNCLLVTYFLFITMFGTTLRMNFLAHTLYLGSDGPGHCV